MINSQVSHHGAKKSMATQVKKSDRVAKHLDQKVSVSNYGTGYLRYFENLGDEKICGIELDEPNGDCDGEDLDGNSHFSCSPVHGVYVTMKEVTLLDSSGKPTTAQTKKASTKPKKKFEDPPSLRKKIIRKDAPSKKGEPKIQKTKLHDNTRKHGAKSNKVDHLSKKKSGIADSVKGFAEAKAIKRTPAAVSAATVTQDSTNMDDELPALENDDVSSARTSIAPEDWVAAAKREQKAKEDAIERERELADIAAQELRMIAAEKKREEEEAAFNVKAAEEARKRDELREERRLAQELKAKERADKRIEQEAAALAMVDEYAKQQEEQLKVREAKAKALNDNRLAQKARIAAMMSRVKTNNSASNSRNGSGTNSPVVTPPTTSL